MDPISVPSLLVILLAGDDTMLISALGASKGHQNTVFLLCYLVSFE